MVSSIAYSKAAYATINIIEDIAKTEFNSYLTIKNTDNMIKTMGKKRFLNFFFNNLLTSNRNTYMSNS